jgi:alpha-tubulin suppressor-like RCC1 family protein
MDCAGPEGACEPTGYCSYPDPQCATGRRYDPYATEGNGDQCTATCDVSVEAGGAFTCAYRRGGDVYCWGSNRYGELGDGNLTSSKWPVMARNLFDAVDLSTGKHHACARTDRGTVECWGGNAEGQIGDGTTEDRSVPVTVDAFQDSAISVAAGGAHTCVRLVGGEVWCWGDNRLGQVGEEVGEQLLSPRMVAGMTGAVGLAMGENHTCAYDASGGVWCWGYNGYGQLGDGTTSSGGVPRRVGHATLSGAVQLVAGGSHSCARTESQQVWCWGANYSGQLGVGTTSGSSVPVRVDLPPVLELAAGASHTCALTFDGAVWCWGANTDGQVGDGSRENRSLPVEVRDLSAVVEVTAGMAHTCARGLDGRVSCWGSTSDGQLGDGSYLPAIAPVIATTTCR